MRLAYTADLHGDIGGYQALLDLAVAAGAGAAIVGGDLLPHAVKLAAAVATQREFVTARLRPLLEAFRAANPGINIYLLAGNDDWAAAIAELEDLARDDLAHPLHERVHSLLPAGRDGRGGLWLAGYACVPLTPFSIKDYERRDDAPPPGARGWAPRPISFGMAYVSAGGSIRPAQEAEIAALPTIGEALEALAQRSDPSRTIYVCHTPPANTPLDQMAGDRHVGSWGLRGFIERHAPPLTLHGHIHESPSMSGRFATKLGATWCVNPGHDPRRFQAVTLDTDDIAGTIRHTVLGPLRG